MLSSRRSKFMDSDARGTLYSIRNITGIGSQITLQAGVL